MRFWPSRRNRSAENSVKPDLPVPRIGMDEFLAAQRDPKVHTALRAALVEGERLEQEQGRKA